MVKKVFYILITGFFIVLWLRLVNLHEMAGLIGKANWFLVATSIVLSIFAGILVAYRQKLLFGIINVDVSLAFLWSRAYLAGLSTVLLPFFTGGFVFAHLVAKKIKTSYVKTFSIIFADFSLGIMTLVLFGCIAAIRWGLNKPVILLAFFGLVSVLIIVVFRQRLKAVIKLLTKNKLILIRSLGLTFIIYFLGILQSYIFFLAFNLTPGFFDFVLASALFGILNLIPGAPTKLGQYEALGVLSFGYLLNMDKTVVSAVFLTQHIATLTLTIGLGLIVMLTTNRKVTG
jgi:uncharacterized membrane protein YbhN (UPF0104 family)